MMMMTIMAFRTTLSAPLLNTLPKHIAGGKVRSEQPQEFLVWLHTNEEIVEFKEGHRHRVPLVTSATSTLTRANPL